MVDMIKKGIYSIYLDEKLIGTAELDRADTSQGVILGKIKFTKLSTAYEFFKKYCFERNIMLTMNDPEYNCLSTEVISGLTVYNKDKQKIPSMGNYIEGMDSDGFSLVALGIEKEFFDKEFPVTEEINANKNVNVQTSSSSTTTILQDNKTMNHTLEADIDMDIEIDLD